MTKTQLLSNESIFFIYQQVKKPSTFLLGAIQCLGDEMGVTQLKDSEDIGEIVATIKSMREQLGIAYAITNSIAIRRLLIEENINSKKFPMFLNDTKKETERVIIYSSYKRLISGVDLQVETLVLGNNISLLDGSTSMGYMVDYAHIKTHTIAVMDYLAYRIEKPNIDRISKF